MCFHIILIKLVLPTQILYFPLPFAVFDSTPDTIYDIFPDRRPPPHLVDDRFVWKKARTERAITRSNRYRPTLCLRPDRFLATGPYATVPFAHR